MEQRYIDSLTEICGKANVFYEMADIERYLYDETEEYVRPKACEDCIVVRPGTYEEVSEILKWANQELDTNYSTRRRNWCMWCGNPYRTVCYYEYGAF